MKKFYLCKLCLIVFGSLLAVQEVRASERVIQSGEFLCEIVFSNSHHFKNGRVVSGTDRQALDRNLTVKYGEYEKAETKKISPSDSTWIEITIAGYSSSTLGGLGKRKLSSKLMMHSDSKLFAFWQDGEKFYASDRGDFFLTLTRIYKEDWVGFITENSDIGEGGMLTSGLRCKRIAHKGL